MKKLALILLSLLLIVSLTACDRQESPNVETEPATDAATEPAAEAQTEVKYIVLEITHEIAPDYILKYVNHYDENWTQTGVTTYLNGELNQETTYELDEENDQLLKTVSTSPDGATAEIEYKNTYDDQGNLIVQDQYAEGVLAVHNTFTYDENGNRIRQTSENHSSGSSTTITYDADGNIIRTESTIDARGNMPASHAWVEYTYDENGNEIKAENYYNNGDDCKTTISEYDDQGRKIRSTSTDTIEGTEVPSEVREYTYEGNTVTEKVFDAEGNLQLTGTRVYDEAGNLLSSESESALTGSTNRSTYTYQKVELPVQ